MRHPVSGRRPALPDPRTLGLPTEPPPRSPACTAVDPQLPSPGAIMRRKLQDGATLRNSNVVELRGFEIPDPSMPWRCATNCVTALRELEAYKTASAVIGEGFHRERDRVVFCSRHGGRDVGVSAAPTTPRSRARPAQPCSAAPRGPQIAARAIRRVATPWSALLSPTARARRLPPCARRPEPGLPPPGRTSEPAPRGRARRRTASSTGRQSSHSPAQVSRSPGSVVTEARSRAPEPAMRRGAPGRRSAVPARAGRGPRRAGDLREPDVVEGDIRLTGSARRPRMLPP